MALPNLLSLILLAGLVRKLQKKYFISHHAVK
jgi:Na+/alanine symporter